MKYTEARKHNLELKRIFNNINKTNDFLIECENFCSFSSTSNIRNQLCCEYLSIENSSALSTFINVIKSGINKIIELIKTVYKKIIQILKNINNTDNKTLTGFKELDKTSKVMYIIQLKKLLVHYNIVNELCKIDDLSIFKNINQVMSLINEGLNNKYSNTHLIENLEECVNLSAEAIKSISKPFKEIDEALKSNLYLPSEERNYLKKGLQELRNKINDITDKQLVIDEDIIYKHINEEFFINTLPAFTEKFKIKAINAFEQTYKEFCNLSDNLKQKINASKDLDFSDTYSLYLNLITFIINVQEGLIKSLISIEVSYNLDKKRYGIFK